MNKDYSNNTKIQKKIYLQIWRFFNCFFFFNFLGPISFYRVFLLKIFGAKIEKNVIIKPGVRIYDPSNLVIKSGSWIGENANLYSLDKIIINNNVVISQEVYLCTGSHNFKSNKFETIHKPIIVNENCWICLRSTILMGVEIPKNSIIKACTLIDQTNLSSNIIKI